METYKNKQYKDYFISQDKFELDEKNRTLVHVLATNIENRNGRIVDPFLIDNTNYRSHPIVTLDHLNSALAQVGVSEWEKIDGNKYIGKTRFINTPDADALFSIITQTMNAATSLEYMAIDEPKIIDKQNGDYAIQFGKVELLAHSFVGVPANPQAVWNKEYLEDFENKVLNMDFINSLQPSSITENLQVMLTNKELRDEFNKLKEEYISQKSIIDELKGKLDTVSNQIKFTDDIKKQMILNNIIKKFEKK